MLSETITYLSNILMLPRIYYIIILLPVLFVNACSNSSSSDDPGNGDSSLRLAQQVFQTVADSSGHANFNFSVPAGFNAFQLAASAGSLTALSGPQGNLLSQTSLVSTAQRGNVTNVNYYSSSQANNGSYSASYSAPAGQSVTLVVSAKSDSNLSGGTLKLNIVMLGPVANSQDILDALDKSLEAARITFGRKNISLDTVITNFEGPATAPEPGDSLYGSIVAAQRADSITVVLASKKTGSGSNGRRYGTIGAIPFPVNANANSVVIISIQDITGGDGTFNNSASGNRNNDDQKRIMGEEISRFTSLALGLPNIVEIQGGKAASSDDIPDSPSCITRQACQEDSDSRTNLMYPEPLQKTKDNEDVGTGNKYFPRDQLTTQQGQVLNNSVFVD